MANNMQNSESFDPTTFFSASGTMRHDSPSYIKRPPDDELYRATRQGELCYVLTPRQMGKSSLMVRTARRLQHRGVHTAIIDLTQIGTDLTSDQWYLGLLTRLKSQLRLQKDVQDWWSSHKNVPLVLRFTNFLREVVLDEIADPIVIFIDEIDQTLALDFTDDFFAAIRAVYNARANEPAYERLSFVLLGVATPADLIKDRKHTPFNIGKRFDLREFSPEDAANLKQALELALSCDVEAIFERIFYWTNGHPFLTQKLCLEIALSGRSDWDIDSVDKLVENTFLSKKAMRETNIQFIREYIKASPHRRNMMVLYKQVHQGKKAVHEDERSVRQSLVKLIGLVQVEKGQPPRKLVVRNRIYGEVFNQTWIDANMPLNWRLILVLAAILVVTAVFLSMTYLPAILNSDADPTSTATAIVQPTEMAIDDTATPLSLTPVATQTLELEPTKEDTAVPPPSPSPTITPTMEPSATNTATAIPTATNTATPTLPTPAQTPTAVPRPAPTNLNFTCNDVENFFVSDTIPFRWRWTGQILNREYLEIRIGPRGSSILNSEGEVSPNQGTAWEWPIPASQFFVDTAYDYHWEIVHMAANGQGPIARSVRGCIHVEPNP